MLMRGITPPPLGSVRDRLMSEMFAREKLLEHENLATMAIVMAHINGVTKESADKIFKILDEHRERQLFKHWMMGSKREQRAKVVSDQEMLERLNRMGRK